MSADKSYYDYGFKVKKYCICEDCQKDANNRTQTTITTPFQEFQGYEGLLRIINELSVLEDGTTQSVNFYDAVREAYTKSNSFREYLSDYGNKDVDINKIDKNYTPLWGFTYQFASGLEPRITINMHHDGDYDVCWVPDAEKDMKFNHSYVEAFEKNEKQKKTLNQNKLLKHKRRKIFLSLCNLLTQRLTSVLQYQRTVYRPVVFACTCRPLSSYPSFQRLGLEVLV